jgi:hypothetical protein
MAEKIALNTGASKSWLLSNDPELAAVCERDTLRPFSAEVFWMTRAEVLDPRLEPLDVVAIENVVACAYARLNDSALQAYQNERITYFHYMLREFLEELGAHWPESHQLAPTMVAAEIQAQSNARFEKIRQQKIALSSPTAAAIKSSDSGGN